MKDPVYDNSYTQQAYDELEAKYDTDKDNVRLKSCPPPFSDISYNGFSDNKGKPIAIADMNNIKHISIEMFEFGYLPCWGKIRKSKWREIHNID